MNYKKHKFKEPDIIRAILGVCFFGCVAIMLFSEWEHSEALMIPIFFILIIKQRMEDEGLL